MGSYQVMRSNEPPGRLWFLRCTMQDAYRAQGGLCAICGHKMPPLGDYDVNRGRLPSCEHVIPRCMGGGDKGNIVAAHRICNELKKDRPPTGCELVFLLAVNARLGVKPDRW